MSRLFTVAAGLLVIALAACSAPESTPTPTSTPIQVPWGTPTPTPSPTPTIWPWSTPTPTPTPDLTPRPTATPRPTPTPTLSPTPTPSPTPCPGSCLMDQSTWDDGASPIADDVAEAVVRIGFRNGSWFSSAGTGFIIGSDPGTGAMRVVTAYHVVSPTAFAEFGADVLRQGGNLTGSTTLEVVADTRPVTDYTAELAVHDADLDLAILTACCFDDSHTVTTVGFHLDAPETWFPAFLIGFSSAGMPKSGRSARLAPGEAERDGEDIWFSGDVKPGDSGGPVFDSLTGEVVGMLVRSQTESIFVDYEREGQSSGPASQAIFGVSLLTPTPTPTPTPVPTPTPTPRVFTQDVYEHEVRAIQLAIAEVLRENVAEFLRPEDFDMGQHQRVAEMLRGFADALVMLGDGAPAVCNMYHRTYVEPVIQRVRGLADDPGEPALTPLLDAMQRQGVQGYRC